MSEWILRESQAQVVTVDDALNQSSRRVIERNLGGTAEKFRPIVILKIIIGLF